MSHPELPHTDDDILFLEEDEIPSASSGLQASPWKILVVDDDTDVHQATELALRDLPIEGRPLTLLHAHSGGEAIEIVANTPDLAVILLDVVMESEDAGLQVVRHVRERMQRKDLRIILRTGQPGYAPEMDTIRNYDINDYKTKSELTQVRLFTSLTTAVRAYLQMRAHDDMQRGLEMVVKASTELNKLNGMQRFAEGVVAQLCALLQMAPEGLICAQQGLENGREPARVIAAAGSFRHLVHQPLDQLDLPWIQNGLERCLTERRNLYEPGLLLYFGAEAGRGVAAFVDIRRPLEETEQHLLEVFCASIAVGFENVILYGRLVDQAYLDPMLRIPNLNRLLEVLEDPALEKASTTLAILDIDDFSAINDTLGHEMGDALLHAISRRLGREMPQSLIARLGSDIFALLGPSHEVAPAPLHQLFTESFEAFGQSVRISATIGLVQLSLHEGPGARLLKDAHVALKQAKVRQRGATMYFSEAMGQDARERMRLLIRLREAFDTQHLFLVYQPKIHLHNGGVSGVEALLRWRTADGGFVPPDRFIPLAEQSGLMTALGTFVLRTACQQLARLTAAGYGNLIMAINISQAQLRDPDFIRTLKIAIEDANVPPTQIELEITESMAADDLPHIQTLLNAIQDLGFKVAIDDFGTGFSSLSVLRHLHTQRLKIDRSFIHEILEDDSIARMVIGLGHSLGMGITAEGVETEAQCKALVALGCDEGQGWLFARPMEEEGLLTWLAQRKSLPCA
ncbi:EAL domain-containing protein [Desulfobotulus sp.]|jgi:diguanylate cyclase (GGDEF)-like protein|uniref:GGDEF/EAL domain-containing response regulator n=1 Tax=Desulfobotulus sp. TaxID=1940337 RepID=UPI002A36549E|nr:EAL domain-containing protein [Desulfobotulus sp.]MDY0164382.1 EAL domain-containing protein [Desulfobotulus sp.]